MADTIFYKRGDAYHDSAGNPAIIEKGNELTFTEHFNAGGGYELPVAGVNTLGGVKIGNGVNINENGVISVTSYTPPAYSTEEHLTGRKWIDGKDIYEKVVTLDTPLTVSRNGSDTGIAPFHETMIDVKGNATNGACINFMEFIQDNTIHLACSNDFSVNNIIFTYTKTTPTRTSKKKG